MNDPTDIPAIRICHERIIPDSMDPERLVRRALRTQLIEQAGGTRDPEAIATGTRMAVVKSKKWAPGSTLRCRFLDGSAKMRKSVTSVVSEWEKHANIHFKFVSSGSAEIRISFYADAGSWSAVGRDALNAQYFPTHQPTMNFGWVREGAAKDVIQSVVLHEFGHALGCIHEHQAPTFDRVWDEKKVLEYFQGAPNYWDTSAIRDNVLSKYPTNGVIASKFDPKSIMLYMFDGKLFADGKGGTNENASLSKTDRKMIAELYPQTA